MEGKEERGNSPKEERALLLCWLGGRPPPARSVHREGGRWGRERERPSGKAALSPTSASMRSLPPSPFPANHPHGVFLGFSPSLKASSSSSLFPSFHQKRDGPSCPVLLPTLVAPETHRRRRGRRPPCYSFLVLRRRHGIHTHTHTHTHERRRPPRTVCPRCRALKVRSWELGRSLVYIGGREGGGAGRNRRRDEQNKHRPPPPIDIGFIDVRTCRTVLCTTTGAGSRKGQML